MTRQSAPRPPDVLLVATRPPDCCASRRDLEPLTRDNTCIKMPWTHRRRFGTQRLFIIILIVSTISAVPQAEQLLLLLLGVLEVQQLPACLQLQTAGTDGRTAS